MKIPQIILIFASAVVLFFITFGLFLPLFSLLQFTYTDASFWPEFLNPAVLQIAKMTFYQAVLSALASAAIGLPLGLYLGKKFSEEGLRRAASILLGLPFVIPTVVAAVAWTGLLGRNGLLFQMGLDWGYSLKAVILAHVFFNAPWIALQVALNRSFVPEETLNAARTLGATALSRFAFVIWPYIRRALALSTIQAYGFCTMSFALVLILGGGPPVQTLETALYSKIRLEGFQFTGALACALWQFILTFLPWIIVCILSLKHRERFSTQNLFSHKKKYGFAVFLCCLLLLPYANLVLQIFQFDPPEAVFFETLMPALMTSILLAAVTCVLTLILSVSFLFCSSVLKRTPVFHAGLFFLLNIPTGFSILVFGLGFWIAYQNWMDPFEGSFWAMAALQTTLFLPFSYRTLSHLNDKFNADEYAAALSLGANPYSAFYFVEWPKWRRSVFVLLSSIAAMSLGEVAAVSFFYSEKIYPLSLMVNKLMSRYQFKEAYFVSFILFGAILFSTLLWQLSPERRNPS